MRNRTGLAAGITAVVWALAGAALAQGAAAQPELEPKVQVYGGPSLDIQRYDSPNKTLLRRARPEGALSDWISADDPAVRLLRSEPALRGGVTMQLQVGADGQVAGCELRQDRGDPRLADGLCDKVRERARFLPALDMEGRRTADVFDYGAVFSTGYRAPGADIVHIIDTPYAPAPGPVVWPPYYAGSAGRVEDGLDLLPGGPRSPEAEGSPWAGIELRKGEDGRLQCRRATSSGDEAFDSAACEAALRGRYQLTGDWVEWRQFVTLHFVSHEGRPQALPQVHGQTTEPRPTPESAGEVLANLPEGDAAAIGRIRTTLSVDSQGRLTGCEIRVSSRSDDLDVAACAVMRRFGRFTPSEDIFGRPQDGTLGNWPVDPRVRREPRMDRVVSSI